MDTPLSQISMLLDADCFPCFFRQVNIAMEAAGAPDSQWQEVLKAVLEDIGGARFDETPAHASSRMHERLRRMLGRDPFESLKSEYNQLAMGLLPSLRERVRASGDPLNTAARLAIAGNIIDFGIFRSVDIDSTVERAMTGTLAVDHTHIFRREVDKAQEILVLLDNAGEIVFDMVLIEELVNMGKKVTAVTRGGPVLNDVTLQDARDVGLDKLCRVIENGSTRVGTIMEDVSEELRELMYKPGMLIISKGQGNFETLIRERLNIFYLFQSKCDVVSRRLGVELKDMLLVSAREAGA